MTIILFLIDTSASMNQRTFMGTSILDVAKTAVDSFLKLRQKDPSRQYDRYMLLTFEDPPNHLKAGWKENHATFTAQLKSLRPAGTTNFGRALANAFHLLNVNRLSSAIDSFGTGRRPFYLEPVILITLTDGCSVMTADGIQKELEFRLPDCLGSEMCKEPFRWDQRLFTVVLRIPASEPENVPPAGCPLPSDPGPSTLMSEVTGGRSYSIFNQQMLGQCLDSLAQKVQHGVVVVLEKDDVPLQPAPVPVNHSIPKENGLHNGYPEPNGKNHDVCLNGLSPLGVGGEHRSVSRCASPCPEPGNDDEWHHSRLMLCVQRATKRGFSGYWPIPEEYWPDPQSSSLPARSAHPILKFSCKDAEPLVFENLPFDKYELEPSPLTQKILDRKQPSACWQVYVPNSGKNGTSAPIGYLKASTSLTCVNLFVMPYNYPKLLTLLKELVQIHNCKPSKEWRGSFDKYLKSVPSYYIPHIRDCLRRIGLSDYSAITDHHTSELSYSVVTHLKRVKLEAKQEYERLCQVAAQSVQQSDFKPLVSRVSTPVDTLMKRAGRAMPLYSELTALSATGRKEPPVPEPAGGHLRLPPRLRPDPAFLLTSRFTNPFDIPRSNLIHQVEKMRANFLHRLSRSGSEPHLDYLSLQSTEATHTQLIEKMGSYHEYASLMPALLRPLEAAPVRVHAFGNPFKIDKKNMHADEIDIDVDMPTEGNRRGSTTADSTQHLLRKRKPGPLGKNYRYKRRRPGQGTAISEAFEFAPYNPSDLDSNSDVESLTDDSSLVLAEIDENGRPQSSRSEEMVDPADELFAPYETMDYDQQSTSRDSAESRVDVAELKSQVAAGVRKPGDRHMNEVVELVKKQPSALLRFAMVEASRFKRHRLRMLLQRLSPT